MPIYEFKCNRCSYLFDELVPMNTTGDLLKCPQCGQVGARRLVSAFAAHGLENGHIAVGRKLTGGSSAPPSTGAEPGGQKAPEAPAAAPTAAATKSVPSTDR